MGEVSDCALPFDHRCRTVVDAVRTLAAPSSSDASLQEVLALTLCTYIRTLYNST
jgi:hypothetical protein